MALSFDDGPDAMTPVYLDTLDRLGIRATFFVIGANCERHPHLVKEMVRRGHDVVPHGFSHRRFPLMTARELFSELKQSAKVLSHLPQRRGNLVRPPGGHVTVRTIALCSMFGYTTALWSLNSEDCREKDPEKIARATVPDDVRPGEIVLMHEGQEWTLEALPLIVERARARGYTLCRVSDLLAGSASPAA